MPNLVRSHQSPTEIATSPNHLIHPTPPREHSLIETIQLTKPMPMHKELALVKTLDNSIQLFSTKKSHHPNTTDTTSQTSSSSNSLNPKPAKFKTKKSNTNTSKPGYNKLNLN